MTDIFTEPPIIDTHCHVFTRTMPLTETAWIKPDYDYAVETYLTDLDMHGVVFGVITAASLFGEYNDYTLACLDAHDRLRATVMLDPDTGPDELNQLHDRGVRGVRLQIPKNGALPDLTTYRFRRFVRRLADAKLHLELNLSGVQLAIILPTLADQGVETVIDHFALLRSEGGMEGEGFKAAMRSVDTGRTWVKLSAGFRLPSDALTEYAERLVKVAGPERLLWGSDAPYVGHEGRISYAETLHMFYNIVPDAHVRRRISDAGLRLYFF